VINLIVRLILAVISMVIGVIGLLMPVLPGWLFFGVAMLLLFPNARLSRRVLAKVEEKFPALNRALRFILGS